MIDNFPKYYFQTPSFSTTDISSFFDYFMNEFFTLISTLFKLLDSIEIYGVGLLNILVTFFVIGIIIPIILTLVRSRSVARSREKRIEKKRHKENMDRWNAV